jgi:hypothetical protein
MGYQRRIRIILDDLSEENAMGRHQELEKEGWVKQFTADEPRLSEAVEEYRELGFEIHLEPLDPLEMDGEECTRCLKASCTQYKVIYTRNRH